MFFFSSRWITLFAWPTPSKFLVLAIWIIAVFYIFPSTSHLVPALMVLTRAAAKASAGSDTPSNDTPSTSSSNSRPRRNNPTASAVPTPKSTLPKSKAKEPAKSESLHTQLPLYVTADTGSHIQAHVYGEENILLPTREYSWHVLGDPPYIGQNKVNMVDLFELMYWRRIIGIDLPHDVKGVSVPTS